MQRNLNPGPRVGGSRHTERPQSVEQKGESRSERRQRGGNPRVEPQSNIRVHMVRHRERTTTEVVAQDKEKRHSCSHPRPEQSREHLVEKCRLLADKREMVERKELREWKTSHSRSQNKKEKGPVEPGKEEEDKLEIFFSHLYEFHNPVQIAPVPVFIPAELPARYAINFVPAAVPVYASAPATAYASSPSTEYSVVSSTCFAVPPSTVCSIVRSVNFVIPTSPVSSPCIVNS